MWVEFMSGAIDKVYYSVGTCLWHVSNALTHCCLSKHAKGMSLRYGVIDHIL